MSARYRADDVVSFAFALLSKSGLDDEKSLDIAEILVEGDLLGHTTHGLALLAPYLDELEKDGMNKAGEPRVLADFPAAITWDGMKLPRPWLVRRAIVRCVVGRFQAADQVRRQRSISPITMSMLALMAMTSESR